MYILCCSSINNIHFSRAWIFAECCNNGKTEEICTREENINGVAYYGEPSIFVYCVYISLESYFAVKSETNGIEIEYQERKNMNKEELKKNLKELYVLYRFRLERELENILVFIYCVGYFHNAEIVLLKENDVCRQKANEIKNEYEEIEYNSVVIEYYESIQATHNKLFNAFFNLKDSQKRLQWEYTGFCEKKTEKLLDKYIYIPCHYRNGRGGGMRRFS